MNGAISPLLGNLSKLKSLYGLESYRSREQVSFQQSIDWIHSRATWKFDEFARIASLDEITRDLQK